MKLITTKILSVLALTLCLTSTAHATLFTRLGGDAIYDDVLDITWLSNANLALSNQFGLSLSTTSAFDDTANTVGSTGLMTWDNANAWIAGMNSANHLGYNDWRLPTLSPINGSTFRPTLPTTVPVTMAPAPPASAGRMAATTPSQKWVISTTQRWAT